MGYQQGANSGVSGLVAISGSPKFTARVYKFSQDLGVQQQGRSGPGTGRWKKTRALLPNGTLALVGKVVLTGFPLPTDWRGQEGTIVLQQHTSVTATVAVRVIACKISLDQKSEDQWDVSLVCEITSSPVLSGFTGTQPAPTDPTPTTQETWENRSKTYDPDGIISTATQRFSIDWFNWAETDDAERSKLVEIIAAATAPLPNLKLHHGQIDRTDRDGGIAVLSWNLTTSAEDIINANTRKTIDPSGLNSSATVAGINITPTAPTGDAFVLTSSLSYELNDNNILYVDTYGLRTNQQALEEDSSNREDDPQDLNDSCIVAVVTTSSTPPAIPTATVTGTKHRNTITKQLNPGHYLHIFQYGRRNSADDIIMEATVTDIDPNLIDGSAVIAVIYASTDTPATPAAPTADVKYIRTTTKSLHDTRLLYLYHYGPRDSKDEIEMPGTVTGDDAQNLNDYAQITKTNNSSTPPATPSAPVGTKLVKVETQQIHSNGTTAWKHTFHYARRDSMDELLMELARYTTDANALNNTATIARFAASEVQPATPAAPTDTKLIDISHHQIHDTAWVYVFRYGPRDSKDDIQMRGTSTQDDPQGILLEARITLVEASGTPNPPTAPANQKYRYCESKPLKDGKYENTYVYGARNSKDDEEMGGTETQSDAAGLEGSKQQTVVNESSTPPATPAAPSGLKLRFIRIKQLNDGKYRHTFIYAPTTTEDDIEMGGTFSAADTSALEDRGEITVLNDTSTPPATPTVPTILPGAKYIKTVVKQRNDGKWTFTYQYGPRTSEEDITMGGTQSVIDPNSLRSRERITQVTALATRPLTPTPTLSDVKYVGGETQQIKSGKYKHVFDFAVNDSADEVTTPRQTAIGEVSGGISNTVASILNGPSAYLQALSEWAARKGDVTFERVTTQRLSDNKILQVVHVTDAFQIVTFQSHQGLGKKLTWARVIGGVVKVFLAQKLQLSSTRWWYRLSSQLVPCCDMFLGLRRKVSGGTLPMYWDYSGKINSGSFLGLDAKTVIYIGAGGQSNIAIAAPRVSGMDWQFYHDSNGFADETEIPQQGMYTATDLSSLSAGSWVLASALGLGAAELPTADYSAFLA